MSRRMLSVQAAHERIMSSPFVAHYEVFKNPKRYKVDFRKVRSGEMKLVGRKLHGDEVGLVLKTWDGQPTLPRDQRTSPVGPSVVFYGSLRVILNKAVVALEAHEAKVRENQKREKIQERMSKLYEKYAAAEGAGKKALVTRYRNQITKLMDEVGMKVGGKKKC